MKLSRQTATLNKGMVKNNFQSFQQGFTLIEMLLYMGILAILISVLSVIFGAIIDVQLESQSTSSVDQDGKYLLSKIAYDMKQATGSAIPANPGVITNQLRLQIPGNSLNYIYSLDGNNNLQVVTSDGTNVLNSSDTKISNVQFQRIGTGGTKDTIRMSFTITSRTKRASGNESQTLQTTMGFQ